MGMSQTVRVVVSGPLACFTRPEAKVERVSYPVMTPSAARGCLEAIVWKPQFRWNVLTIRILRPIQFASVRRNEIQDTISIKDVQGWMEDPSSYKPYFADFQTLRLEGFKEVRGNRAQRHTLALRDVAYVIEAEPVLTALTSTPRRKPVCEDEPEGRDTVQKYVAMFNRRMEKGQCFQQPYLGLREFVADFRSDDGQQPLSGDDILGQAEYSLGRMFLDFEYQPDVYDNQGAWKKLGGRTPVFAPTTLRHGVLDVQEMRRQAETVESPR
jgi:CRISPR-associated protein Cas5d